MLLFVTGGEAWMVGEADEISSVPRYLSRSLHCSAWVPPKYSELKIIAHVFFLPSERDSGYYKRSCMCLHLMCAKPVLSFPQEINEFLFASNKKKTMEESPRYMEKNEEIMAVGKWKLKQILPATKLIKIYREWELTWSILLFFIISILVLFINIY